MNTKNKSKKGKEKGIIGITLVAIMIASIFAMVAPITVADPDPATTINTVRIYSEDGSGAGQWSPGERVWGPDGIPNTIDDDRIRDRVTGIPVEQQPYTAVRDIFDPQLPQAPRKDSITFNPAYISEIDIDDGSELGGMFGLAQLIKTDGGNSNEKVFFRQWYQPDYLDKDADVSGWVSYRIVDGGDGIIQTAPRGDDVWDLDVLAEYPALFPNLPPNRPLSINPNSVLVTASADGVLETIPGDIDGDGAVEFPETDDYVQEVPSMMPDEHYPAIVQEFTYMFIEPGALADKPEPTAGRPGTGTAFVFPVGIREALFDDPAGYGLTSLDPTLDGVNNPTIVEVHSEQSLSMPGVTGIGADFNGNGVLDQLDVVGGSLDGDELVIMSPPTITDQAAGNRIQFLDHMIEVKEVFTTPACIKIGIWYTGDMEPRFVGDQLISPGDMALIGTKMPATYIQAGGNNIGTLPRGAFFIYVDSINAAANTASIRIGRALGATWTAMEQAAGAPDTLTPDPWWLKRFYVDGHEYNVVAIYSDPNDARDFKFITIRTPIPKEGVDLDPVVLIEQHSVRLQPYEENRPLSVMPPYNYEHTELMDVQDTQTWPITDWTAWIGAPLLTKPIYHTTGPYTRIGEDEAGIFITTEDLMFYVEEDIEPELIGELKEKFRDIRGDVILDLDGTATPGIGSTTVDMQVVPPVYMPLPSIPGSALTDVSTLIAGVVPGDTLMYWDAPEGTPGIYDPWIDWTFYDGASGLLPWVNGQADIGEVVYAGSGTAPVLGNPAVPVVGSALVAFAAGEAWIFDTIVNNWYDNSEDIILNVVDNLALNTYDGTDLEWWYVEQYCTAPTAYTEFYLPVGHGLYLLTPNYLAPEKVEREFLQQAGTTDAIASWAIQDGRVKFWYNASEGGKKYKDEEGVRLYGDTYNNWYGFTGLLDRAGDPLARDRLTGLTPEDLPYTIDLDVFNPQFPQAYPKDILTVDPAWMDEFYNGGEDLVSLYSQLSIEGNDAREKVFMRLWYEPEHLDKDTNADGLLNQVIVDGGNGICDTPVAGQTIGGDDIARVPRGAPCLPFEVLVLPGPNGVIDTGAAAVGGDDFILPANPPQWLPDISYPAVMQENTYMFIGVDNQPAHGQPGVSTFGFPIGTTEAELNSAFGYGLTTFDMTPYNGMDEYNIVTVHSEQSLAGYTGVQCDFDGDRVLDFLDTDGVALSGDELAIFSVLANLNVGDRVQFLDYMIEVKGLSDTPASVSLEFYKLGGLTMTPESMGTVGSLVPGEMVTTYLDRINPVIPAGGSNLALPWTMDERGPWFVYVDAVNPGSGAVAVTVGRALGATHTAMEQAANAMDMTPGDPWYLKRFYVDGHEYNVVALRTVPADVILAGDEPFEFKYITIRTPVQKETTRIDQHSFMCQGYYTGDLPDQISVMPPFNYEHTVRVDIQDGWLPPTILDSPMGYIGPIEKHKAPFNITIVDESVEEQFFGELKELYDEYGVAPGVNEVWRTKWFHTIPDHYTEFHIEPVEKYLVTSSWTAPQGTYQFVNFFAGQPIGIGAADPGLQTDVIDATLLTPILGFQPRVKFWYDPTDETDLYVNTKEIDVVTVSGFVDDVAGTKNGISGANVTVSNTSGIVSYDLTDAGGNYIIPDSLSPGEYTLTACDHPGYITETVTITPIASVTVDFVYENGLIPEDPNMDYVLMCIRLWYEGKISMDKVLEVISAWSS